MMNKGYTLDTNIITEYLNGNSKVNSKINNVTKIGFDVKIDCIAYYEMKRGLEEYPVNHRLSQKLEKLERFCQEVGILLLDEKEILSLASKIWAKLKKAHVPISSEEALDADILIASNAIVKGYTVVSKNIRHFERINNLDNIELSYINWLK